jgi:3-isopropylmalate/(R)-2-methylmalate dehydratase small subunit
MIKDFPLNNKNYSGKILVTGKNFGCGSSREHAVWAIYDYGFRTVVSSFFADIFKNNCLNIGVLPVQISESFLSELFNEIEKDNDSLFDINLPNQSISIMSNGQSESFNISNYKKENMMNGFDDIDYLVDRKEDIITFANKISR